MKFKKPALPKIQSQNLIIVFRLMLECFFLVLLIFSLCGILNASTYFEVFKYAIGVILTTGTAYTTKKL